MAQKDENLNVVVEFRPGARLSEPTEGRTIDGDGGGPHDSDMEARVIKLEVIAEQAEKRFDRMQSTLDRIDGRLASMPTVGGLWGMIATVIGVSLAVLALVAAIFAWRQDQILALGSQTAQPPQPIVIQIPDRLPAPQVPGTPPETQTPPQ